MPRHLTRSELEAGLAEIPAAPPDREMLEESVVRPASGERISLSSCAISLSAGVHGGRWVDGCHPHPVGDRVTKLARAVSPT